MKKTGYVSEEDGTTFTNECDNEEDRASVTDESEINNDDAMPSSKSKKRKWTTESWKKNKRKCLRNSGKCYVPTTKQIVST